MAGPRRGRYKAAVPTNLPSPVAPEDDDKLHEECALFAIHGTSDAAAHTALGLHALQHRGQEASGIVTYDGKYFHDHRARGLVGDIFGDPAVIARLKGYAAIGHNRYATTGASTERNIQPIFADFDFGGLALAHNGNLTNAGLLREELVRMGCLFQSTTDTEVINHLIARSTYATMVDRLIDALQKVKGAYSLVVLSNDAIMGVRDPMGVRPLVLGRLDDAWILCSETCALDILGARFVRDVEPGEIVIIDGQGPRSIKPFNRVGPRFCIFEHIYFARPDSKVEGVGVYDVRKRIGAELAIENAVPADVVVPVPDSGVPAAIGYARQSGLPFELGIIRNHYVGRTFIEPTDTIRHLGVRLKHNANRVHIEGKRVILVDDSIVRGTTSKKIVEMVRQAGAREVHMRIAAPPTTHSCHYGINTPERDKLLAYRYDVAGMAAFIGVDSLAFVSIDGLYRAMGRPARDAAAPGFCDACFTGVYPIPLDDLEGVRDRQLSFLAEPA
ncbi:MAG: amidophosphoribosyltransferase [Alphaproteobacteria bacterium]|nr:amidophosphoribosyltransferase [Alphaproteobacteria bacterium]